MPRCLYCVDRNRTGGRESAYDASKFNGYADVNERNGFFTTFPVDQQDGPETGEYILHDDAIFALYAGKPLPEF